jgi:hypothetical protein
LTESLRQTIQSTSCPVGKFEGPWDLVPIKFPDKLISGLRSYLRKSHPSLPLAHRPVSPAQVVRHLPHVRLDGVFVSRRFLFCSFSTTTTTQHQQQIQGPKSSFTSGWPRPEGRGVRRGLWVSATWRQCANFVVYGRAYCENKWT